MAGFRTFATGEVLTAANVNDFLMKQSVMVFADDAARTAALGAEVTEGMLTYNLDTDQLEVFDGTNFVIAAPEPPAPPAGIGSNVVSFTKTDTQTTSSDDFVAVTGLEVTITPSSDTAKILLVGHVTIGKLGTENAAAGWRLVRDSTAICVAAGSSRPATGAQTGQAGAGSDATTGFCFLDSPATASAVTYKIDFCRGSFGGAAKINIVRDSSPFNATSTITAIEVAA